LKLKHEEPLSKFALKLNLRRYTSAMAAYRAREDAMSLSMVGGATGKLDTHVET
jgi:sRNA-binding protein